MPPMQQLFMKGAMSVEENKEMNVESKENNSDQSSKPAKSKKSSKKENKKGLSDFLAIYKSEFKKVVWPSRKELFKETITVIVVSLAVGAVIFGYDSAFGAVFNKMIELLA